MHTHKKRSHALSTVCAACNNKERAQSLLIHSCNVPWIRSAPRLPSLEARKKKGGWGCLFDGLDYFLPSSTSIDLREVVLRPRGLMTSISMCRKMKKKKTNDSTQKFCSLQGRLCRRGSNAKESSQRRATQKLLSLATRSQI